MGIFGFAKQILALFLTDQGGATKTIYVRSGGSDTAGNGLAPASAYRTLARAVKDIPSQWIGVDYTIDCTGLADTEISTEIKDKRCQNGSVTILATRPILATIATADITLGVADARTQKIVLTVAPSPGWTVNAFRGKYISEIGGSVDGALIISNTANTLTVMGGFFTGGLDCQIEDNGASQAAPVAGGNALILSDLDCSFTLKGIKLDAGFVDYGLRVEDCDEVTIQSCEIVGMITELNEATTYTSVFFNIGLGVEYDFSGNSLYFGCFFYVLNTSAFLDTMQGGSVHLLYCYSNACGSFPRYDNSILRPNEYGTFYAQACEFDLSYRRAVYAYAGYTKIQDCVITDAVTGGVQAVANARLHLVNTIGNITSALATSIGIFADTGADLKVDTTSVITVTGAASEVKVGDQAGTTKATFNALPARTGQIDLTASLITGVVVGTRAHMHQ